MNIYEIRNSTPLQNNQELEIRNLIHIDTYRLEHEQELIDIGAEDYLGQADTVCVVEWPEKIATLLEHKHVINIHIEHVSEQERNITVSPRA